MKFRYVDVVVKSNKMDFQSAMETFAEAWAAANTVKSEAPSDIAQVGIFDIFLRLPEFRYFCLLYFSAL